MTELTPRRRRFAAATLAFGLVLAASGLFLSPAKAAGPAVFGAGYDSYLQENQRGVTAAEKQTGSTCPSNSVVAGTTAWHFVLTANTHDFASLDVALVLNGVNVTLTGLTPKTTADWATFNPALHFIADPNGKHAYVYTSGTGSVRDAASQNAPDSTGPTIVLSHTCAGAGTTTTTEVSPSSTEGTTTTTEVSPSSTEQGSSTTAGETTTPETVAGVQLTRALPKTGSSSTGMLGFGGGALILAGLVILRLGREKAYR